MFKAQVVILAGGQGSRLRPYTTVLPKPLLPVGEMPILEILVRQLKSNGLRRMVISTGYLTELIEAYFGDGRRWDVEIKYVHESKPLGTAGAIKLVKHTEDNFLVVNGDVLTDMNFTRLLKWHQHKKAMATISIREHRIKNDFGVIEVGAHDQLAAYHEKPEYSSFVSMGINAMHVRTKDFIKQGELIGIPDLMLRIKSASCSVCCYKVKDQWFDLGRLEDLERAQEVFKQHKKKFIS